MVSVKHRLQTADRGKMQTADYKLIKYILCYFHYRVLTVNRVIQANQSENLRSGLLSLNITLVRLNITPVTQLA